MDRFSNWWWSCSSLRGSRAWWSWSVELGLHWSPSPRIPETSWDEAMTEIHEKRLQRYLDSEECEVSDPDLWATVHYGPPEDGEEETNEDDAMDVTGDGLMVFWEDSQRGWNCTTKLVPWRVKLKATNGIQCAIFFRAQKTPTEEIGQTKRGPKGLYRLVLKMQSEAGCRNVTHLASVHGHDIAVMYVIWHCTNRAV